MSDDDRHDGYSLAAFTPQSLANMAERLRDPASWKPYNWFGYEYQGTPNSAPQGLGFGEGGALAVIDESGELAGSVQWIPGFWFGGANRNRAWHIGLIILPEHRRSRATRAALRLLIDYLFTHTSANRIEAATAAEAVRLEHALQPVGLRREGVARQAQWREGAWRDVALFAVLRSEWELQRSKKN